MGEPLEDPHGHPIPTRDGAVMRRDLRPLHSFAVGDRLVIREAEDERPERLRRWSDLGLLPGAVVTVRGRHELDGTFEIQVGDHTLTLAGEGIAGFLAEPAGG